MQAKDLIIDGDDLDRIKDKSSQDITLRDAMTARSAHHNSPDLYESGQRWQDKVGGLPSHDSFLSLYKKQNQAKDPMPRAARPWAKMLETGQKSQHWQGLKESGTGNMLRSAIGAGLFLDDVLDNLPDDVEQALETHAQAESGVDKQQETVDNLKRYLDLMATYKGRFEDDESDLTQEIDKESKRLEQEQEVLESVIEYAQEQAEIAEDSVDNNEAQVAVIIDRAAQRASDATDNMMAFASHYSEAVGSDPYNIDSEVFKAAMTLFKKFDDIKKLLDALGYLKQMAVDEARRSEVGKLYHTGYKPGPLNPRTLARSEFVALNSTSPVIKTLALIRLAEGKLKHKTFEGKAQVGRGPIILVVDQSGSMSGPLNWLAVCIEWALIEMAKEQGREIYAIPFGARGEFDIFSYERLDYSHPAQSSKHKFLTDPGQPAALVQHLNGFYNGFGTEPYKPMRAALDLINDNSLKADVMYLGDGDVPPATAQELEALADRDMVKIVCLQLPSPYSQPSKEPGNWADRVVNVNDIADLSQVAKAFEGMG